LVHDGCKLDDRGLCAFMAAEPVPEDLSAFPLQAPNSWRVDAGSRFGEADRMRRDRRERPRRGGRKLDNDSPRKTTRPGCAGYLWHPTAS
jgi:hypothetical protein